jgi:CxxC-x17-CxxC domain-containing protein
MGFQDKSICCSSCGATFIFNADEQGIFQAWDLKHEPRHCPTCRISGGSERSGHGGDKQMVRRKMFLARCADCGKDAHVPFEPRSGRRIYCSDCYRKVRLNR